MVAEIPEKIRKAKEDASSGKKTVNYPVLPRTKLPGRWSSLENNSQAALKIGSASTRPSFVTEETKDEPSAEVVMQPIWPFVNQLPAIDEDRMREALWRMFPYRRPATVPKVEPYRNNYVCMASNASSSNQYLRHVNGLLQQYSANEALLGSISRSSTTTLMNRSSSCSSTGFHVPNINIETSLGKSTEAISLMGMTSSSWGINKHHESPLGSCTKINTSTTHSTFQAQGPNYQELITPYMMNNTVVMQVPGFTSTTTQNFAAAYGNGREVTVPNYMNISMQAPLQAALGFQRLRRTSLIIYVNLDYRGVLQMPRTNPNLFGYDQVKEQADHSPEDAHSVTGDLSPPRVLLDDPDQPEAPLTSPPGRRGSNPDLFEMVYNQLQIPDADLCKLLRS
ncbi:hypothetical protein H6P81_008880 [Aristolochia fimbriata]|uniref:Uncharacterized protein n=1 Tax=Aristolochia fimbriata TaxID=158543 RepID=A0AAV7ELF8_ARIFI|nr:hypothetical protein H6P81_008880 [Aristolochia fimbriata]